MSACRVCGGSGIVNEFDETVTESNAIENWPGPCPNGCPIPDAKPFRGWVESLPAAEQSAIASATAEKVKALAKTKTLDELIAMGIDYAIDKAADEAPHEPITQERIDNIMQRAKESP
jgi:hypothetical protein